MTDGPVPRVDDAAFAQRVRQSLEPLCPRVGNQFLILLAPCSIIAGSCATATTATATITTAAMGMQLLAHALVDEGGAELVGGDRRGFGGIRRGR